MGFFDQFGRNMQSAGRATVNKTKGMADIAKLNNQITENNDKIARTQMELGRQYDQLYRNNPDPALAGFLQTIRNLEQQNEELTRQIQDLKGLQTCPHCQQVIPKTILYCSSCGNRVAPENVTPCPNCGAFVKDGMQFCTQCGTRVHQIDPAPEPYVDFQKEPQIAFQAEPVSESQGEVELQPVQQQMETETVTEPETQPISPRRAFCPGCGSQVQPDEAFCSECGYRL
jgi:hypothetical protein